MIQTSDLLGASVFSTQLYGLPLGKLGIAFALIFGGVALSRLATSLLGRLRAKLEDTHGFREALFAAGEKPSAWVFILVAVYMAIALFELPTAPINVRHFVEAGLLGGSIALAIWFGTNLIDGLCGIWAEKAKETGTAFDDQLVPIVRKSGKVFLVVAGGVMIVQNLGYSVGSLLAGLGIGGAALALASKDSIANIFGSIVIFLDQPFYVGDWIEIGDHEGVVEEVGLRVTRVRTFANSLITIPNAQLTTMTINNWSRMRKRRITMTLGLTYDTKPAQMVAAVEALREVIRQDERLCQDFHLVNFNALNAYSLDIFVYCFTQTTDWAEHLQIRQELLLKFMQVVEDQGLSFAFPTQTLHMGSIEKLIPPSAPAAMTRELPH